MAKDKQCTCCLREQVDGFLFLCVLHRYRYMHRLFVSLVDTVAFLGIDCHFYTDAVLLGKLE